MICFPRQPVIGWSCFRFRQHGGRQAGEQAAQLSTKPKQNTFQLTITQKKIFQYIYSLTSSTCHSGSDINFIAKGNI